MDSASSNSYTHTRALLNYLLGVYGKAKSSSSPPQPPPPASSISLLELSVRKLALAQSHAASATSSSKAPSEVSASTDDEDGDEKSGASVASSTDGLSDEEKIKIIIQKLEDQTVDEDDMPDALKDTLTTLLAIPDNDPVNLDPLILALLHRHREDLHPTGNPVPPLPNHGSTTPGSRPTISRSSSFRRNLTAGTLTPGGTRTAANATLSSSKSSASSRSPSASPWQSPKPAHLSLGTNPNAFKFSVGASEFKPGGAGSGHASPSTPGTPNRVRSPMPMTAQQAQQNWALHHSPLSTPKHSMPPSAPGSALSSPSYFPRQLDPSAVASASKTKIPRLPWADSSESSGAENESADGEPSGARIDDAPLPHETVMAFGGGTNSPFYSPAIPIDQAYAQPYQGDDEPQWADQPPQDGGYFAYGQPVYPPQTEYGGYVGGPLYEQYPYPPGDVHTPTHGLRPLQTGPGPAFITLPGPAPGEMPSIDFANQLTGSSGLGGIGAYAMTPFDHLHSIFAGSDVSQAMLEEALSATGFDVDKSIEYIIDQQIGNHPPGLAGPPPGLDGLPQNRMIANSGSRPLVVSRDSFDAFGGGNGGRGSPRWGSRPGTPTGEGRGVGGRVCRFYLAGNCLRSDCKFSHDVGKAVCKFWLRGHCLKGDGRCDFLHSIPPVMRADYEARTRQRQVSAEGGPYVGPDEGPELDFPSLGDVPRSRRPVGGSGRTIQLDPARTRFSGAVKYGQKVQVPLPARPPPPAAPSRDAMPQPKRSARIALRPPALLPTLPTGQALANLYIRYRQTFLELGANRNKCLAKAAECFKRGDGAGARKWSREAQDWSRQVAIEGRDSALRIVEERKRVLKEAIDRNEGRAGSTDDAPDRKARGHERGGGICLGVVSQAVVPGSGHLTEEERTEVALDLHALHTDEAISFMGDFLLKLEAQQFGGIAYVVIGQQKHSGTSAPDKGEAAGRLRLEQATTEFLSDQGWAWHNFGGILAIDCLR
ncbi:SPOSA6832_03296 [Sporobolomyces salmonicolor]|uniref:SPOSA6832_03296-mRNA-1:cds n=1 Tax=Sporidiobolus salmonicolor TaxID=5005 RepID=A0A0D6ENR5_SPOSA|nr:SPOSA6832_03296 [Sporobolomyces salmonicolor]